ncbi:MAG: sensor domain-containing diguanylate cyclase [gamma proteobacterium symbiont of Taylorina sp.]|nr:sensor domain-containing diguanylate cyclase [gamma proteobacterium symbiont of Taylorina sp.]
MEQKFSNIKQFFKYFLPMLVVVALVSLSHVYQSLKSDTNLLIASDKEILVQSSQITTTLFKQKISDLMILTEGETLKRYLHDDSIKNWVYLAREFETFSRYKKIYDQIRFIDNQGQEKLRVDYNNGTPAISPRFKLQNKASRYYFKESIKLSRHEIYVSPLDLNKEKDKIQLPLKPMIRYATPIFDGYGKKRGILILNYSAKELLLRLKKLFKIAHGQLMMLNNQSYWLINNQKEKQWGFMYNKAKLRFSIDFPQQWKTISMHENGRIDTPDNVFVYNTAYPLVDTLDFTRNYSDFLYDKDKMFRIPLPKGYKADSYYWKLVSVIDNTVFHAIYKEKIIHLLSLFAALSTLTAILSIFFVKLARHDYFTSLELKRLASTDFLTGAFTRREFLNIANKEFSRVRRYNRNLSVIMIDADHFKKINDNYGHSAGDKALKKLSEIVQKNVRKQDSFARFGGEEFIILMPEENTSEAFELAERIRTFVEKCDIPVEKKDAKTFSFTVSMGIAGYYAMDNNFDTLLKRVDRALYLAKDQGRNTVVIDEISQPDQF